MRALAYGVDTACHLHPFERNGVDDIEFNPRTQLPSNRPPYPIYQVMLQRLSSLPSVQLVQLTHLFAFSLIYFLQNLHLTCFLTMLSSVPREYASAITQSASAMHMKRMILSKKLP
jgi:hypothetical protein